MLTLRTQATGHATSGGSAALFGCPGYGPTTDAVRHLNERFDAARLRMLGSGFAAAGIEADAAIAAPAGMWKPLRRMTFSTRSSSPPG